MGSKFFPLTIDPFSEGMQNIVDFPETSVGFPKSVSFHLNQQGPVVQSVVSLTSPLRVISLTILADSIYNILIFLLKKCE